jgi:DNA polymerase-3 subunit gamma/tau
MAYTVLARRYRSGTFDEVIGQDHVAQTLKKAIASGRIAHAFLFCGTRGVGKTSMARILAKALNCQKSDKPTAEPCGKCDSCLAISRGDDIDVIEIDAASNTGVDNVRDVIENSRYSPTNSRFKIYIIDEAHMLSKPAFNALLKTLEEPPSHVKFILATTEAEKLLPTILSRCQRYDFRNIPTREIAEHLADLCKREKVKADEDALFLVARAGAGSMRDALSLLDRLLSIGEKNLTSGMIEQMLGLPKSQLLFDLADAIANGDVKSVLAQADSIVQAGLSPDSLIVALVDHLRNLLILRTCGPDSTLVEVPGLALDDLSTQANRFDPGVLAQDITILEELRRTLRQSQAGRALLDATLVRLALADQFSSIGDLISQLNGGVRAPKSPAIARPTSTQTSAPAVSAPKKKLEPIAETLLSEVIEEASSAPVATEVVESTGMASVSAAEDDDDSLPAVGKVWSAPSESLSSLMAKHRAANPEQGVAELAPAISGPADSDNLPVVWQAMLGHLLALPGLHSLISQGQLVGIAEGQMILRFGARHETFIRAWEKNGKKEQIRDAASKAAGENVGIRFEIDTETPPAPLEQLPHPAPSPVRRPAPAAVPVPSIPEAPTIKITPELVESLKASTPLIGQLMQQFGAQVVKVESP